MIEEGMLMIMRGMELDMSDENFRHTPNRYRRFLQEMFETKEAKWATFDEDYTDFVLLRGHHIHTLCPHHFLPVDMKVSVAYIPNGQVLGLSKLARVLDDVNRGPIMQEKFSRDVISRLKRICKGITSCAVFIEGIHGCMRIRGVKSSAPVITYRCEGAFDSDPIMQQRFFSLAKD